MFNNTNSSEKFIPTHSKITNNVFNIGCCDYLRRQLETFTTLFIKN